MAREAALIRNRRQKPVYYEEEEEEGDDDDLLGNKHVKFEVRSFNRFGALSI